MESAEHAGLDRIAIIIPTMDNRAYLAQCVGSLLRHTAGIDYHVYVVNNGAPGAISKEQLECIQIIEAGGNQGWEGGLALGVECAREPLLLFLNDDTFIPPSSAQWLATLAAHFSDPGVGAAGPSSNFVAGPQSIWDVASYDQYAARFLIGFCMMVRRSALRQVGGIDCSLPGGDDIDLSIRLRKAGYILVGDRRVFVYHHGCTTGARLHGGADVPGGWNSPQMAHATFEALVRKHGAQAVADTWRADPINPLETP